MICFPLNFGCLKIHGHFVDNEWIKKIWYVYTMDYYSAVKKNKIMPFAATRMDLQIIIVSEVSPRRTNTI